MTNIYNVKVNPNKSHLVDTGYTFSQGDFGITLAITVEELDTTGTTVKIGFRKKSGSVEATTLTASGNTYSYVLRGTELDTPGEVIADLKFYNASAQRISTASFKFMVAEDVLAGLPEEAHSWSDSLAQQRAAMVDEVKGDISPVQYVPQVLTDAQKLQARTNIGVPSTGLQFKGTVAAVGNLPASAAINDFYIVAADGHIYTRNAANTAWVDSGKVAEEIGIQSMISDAWSSATTYAVGDYAIDNNSLYRCIVAHSNKKPSTYPAYWTAVTVGEELSAINRELSEPAKYEEGLTSELGTFPDAKHKGYLRVGSLVFVSCSFKPTSNVNQDTVIITGFPRSIGRMPINIFDYNDQTISGLGNIDFAGKFTTHISLTANHSYMLSGLYEDVDKR